MRVESVGKGKVSQDVFNKQSAVTLEMYHSRTMKYLVPLIALLVSKAESGMFRFPVLLPLKRGGRRTH